MGMRTGMGCFAPSPGDGARKLRVGFHRHRQGSFTAWCFRSRRGQKQRTMSYSDSVQSLSHNCVHVHTPNCKWWLLRSHQVENFCHGRDVSVDDKYRVRNTKELQRCFLSQHFSILFDGSIIGPSEIEILLISVEFFFDCATRSSNTNSRNL